MFNLTQWNRLHASYALRDIFMIKGEKRPQVNAGSIKTKLFTDEISDH